MELLFREVNMDSVLLGLKVTSELSAHFKMVLRSLLRLCPAWSRKCTMVNKLVLCANNGIEYPMSLTI